MPLLPVCRPCLDLDCTNPDDFSAGIDSAIYSALDYSFIVNCPEGCYCPPGLFPQTISILASTIPPVIPPTTEPGFQIELRLQGCLSTITRTLSGTATMADIQSAAQSMQAEWAGQQAQCIAQNTPGVNCNTGTSISVCNDGQTICCPGFGPITIAAGVRCQNLNTTGLTQAQINAETAALKASLNALAIDSFCPGFKVFCSLTSSTLVGGDEFKLTITNAGVTDFDTSSFKAFNLATNALLLTAVRNVVHPGENNIVILDGVFGAPPTTGLYVTLNGVIIFTTGANFNFNSVFAAGVVNCGPPPPPPC